MLKQHLYPNETVLWEGKPFLEKEYKRGRERVIYFVAGLLLGLVCFFCGAYIGAAPGRLNMLMTLGLILLLIVPMWFGVLVLTRPTPSRRFRKTYYAVTDERILILRGDKLSQYGLNEVVVKYFKFADGASALVFFDNETDLPPVSGTSHRDLLGNSTVKFRFGKIHGAITPGNQNVPGALAGLYCIQNPLLVEQLIKQAQKDAKNHRTY